jgi:hypothetical protein
MSVGQLLRSSIRLYLDHWKPLLTIAAIVLVPYTFLVAGFVAASGLESIQPGVAPPPEVILRALRSLAVVATLALFVNPFVTAAMLRAGADLYLGRGTTVGDTYRTALNRLGSVLLVLVLGALLMLGVALVFIIPLLLVLGFSEQGTRPWTPVVAIPLVMGGVFAVTAVAIRVTLGPVTVMLEPARGREALRRSWSLVQGYGWRVFGAVLLLGLVSLVVTALLSSPFARLGAALEPGGWLLAAVGEALANVVIAPFTAILIVLLYFDLRIRKEGFDPSRPAQEPLPPPAESTQ